MHKNRASSTIRLAVEQLHERITPYANWHINGINDVVFDQLREIIYIPTKNGTVERYDQANKQRLTPWLVGSNLLDADITPDGNTLVLAEGNTTGQLLKLYRIDLNTAAITTISYPSLSNGAGVNHVVMMSNNIGYFTTVDSSYYLGEASLLKIDLSTSGVQVIGTTRGPVSLTRNELRNTMVIRGDQIAKYLNAQGETTTEKVLRFNGNAIDLNPAGNLGGTQVSDGIAIFDTDFNGVTTLWKNNETLSVLAFDPDQPRVFAYTESKYGSFRQIIGFDTTNWTEQFRMPAATSEPLEGIIRPSGRNYLIYHSANNITIDDYYLPQGPRAALRFTAYPQYSMALAGEVRTVTITARDLLGQIDSNYQGTIRFTSTDPTASLPSDYTFTLADGGVKQFTYTVNQTNAYSRQDIDVEDINNPFNLGGGWMNLIYASTPEIILAYNRTDSIFDPHHNMLYLSTGYGLIQRYDLTAQKLLDPWKVGNNLQGMDLSPDGQYLFVTDATRNLTQGVFHQIELSTGIVTPHWFDHSGYFQTLGSLDIAFASNNIGLIVIGDNEALQYNLTTNQITPSGISGIGFTTQLSAIPTRNRILIDNGNSWRVYDATLNGLVNTTSPPRRGVAISSDGTTIYELLQDLLNIDDGTRVNWPSFEQAGRPTVFDPVRHRFYFEQDQWVVAYDLASGQPVAGYPFTRDQGSPIISMQTRISDDGRWYATQAFNSTRLLGLNTPITTRIDVADTQVIEGTGGMNLAQVRFTLSAPSTQQVRASYATYDGTASFARDYQLTQGTLVFEPGVTELTVSIPITSDTVYEFDEWFRVDLLETVNAFRGANHYAIVTIVDDEAQPRVQFSQATSSGFESNQRFLVELVTDAPTERPIKIHFEVDASSTATRGVDYQMDYWHPSGEMSIGSNGYLQFEHQIDPDYEPDETILFRLTSAENGELGSQSTHIHTILNDDPVTVTWVQTQLAISESQTRPILQAHLAVPLPYATSIGFEVLLDGTARTGADYVLTGNRLYFPAGTTVANVPLRITNDTLYEDDETLSLLLTDPRGGIGVGSASQLDLTILNNDAKPAVSFATDRVLVREQQRILRLTDLVLSKPAGKPITIAVLNQGVTAQLWEDYDRLPYDYFTFAPGQTRLPFELQLYDDLVYELPVEITRFSIAPEADAVLGRYRALSVLIRDNDPFPQVHFTPPVSTARVSEEIVGVTIQLSRPAGVPLRFQLAALPGSTARLGVDYTWEVKTVQLWQYETETTFTLRLLNNSRSDRILTLRLGLVSAQAPFGMLNNIVHTLTILKDE